MDFQIIAIQAIFAKDVAKAVRKQVNKVDATLL